MLSLLLVIEEQENDHRGGANNVCSLSFERTLCLIDYCTVNQLMTDKTVEEEEDYQSGGLDSNGAIM